MEILSCIVGGNTIALLKELKDFDMLTTIMALWSKKY
jgi:peptidase E